MRFFRTQERKPIETRKHTELSSVELPIVVSARTGLASKDDAIIRRVPIDYEGKTIEQLLEYIGSAELNDG